MQTMRYVFNQDSVSVKCIRGRKNVYFSPFLIVLGYLQSYVAIFSCF